MGCAAGFLNAVKIKGSHTAMKSGMVAAEATYEALMAQSVAPVSETGEVDLSTGPVDLSGYVQLSLLLDCWLFLTGNAY